MSKTTASVIVILGVFFSGTSFAHKDGEDACQEYARLQTEMICKLNMQKETKAKVTFETYDECFSKLYLHNLEHCAVRKTYCE